jgi:hypothetical protein
MNLPFADLPICRVKRYHSREKIKFRNFGVFACKSANRKASDFFSFGPV